MNNFLITISLGSWSGHVPSSQMTVDLSILPDPENSGLESLYWKIHPPSNHDWWEKLEGFRRKRFRILWK